MLPAGKVPIKVATRRLSVYCKAKGLIPEEECRCRLNRSTTNMMFVVRRQQEIRPKAGVSLFICFMDIQKAYNLLTAPCCSEYSLASEYHGR